MSILLLISSSVLNNPSYKRPYCKKKLTTVIEPIEEVRNPCNPSPCGANAICKERNGAGSCSCVPNYFGDPYTGCRPECVINADCPMDRACIGNKCANPCPGTCGLNAECIVSNHAPSCFCFEGYTGNPAVACHVPPPRMYLFYIYTILF